MTTPTVPLGPKEVADLLGVNRETVWVWRYRSAIPEPDLVVSGVPMWWPATIDAWRKATGR